MSFAYLVHRLSDWFHGDEYMDTEGKRRVKWEVDAAGPKETQRWAVIKPMRRAFRALMRARAELGRDDVQIIAEDVPVAEGKVSQYALCLWQPLYRHLCRLAPGTRHMYAVVMERHNPHGIPLIMDLDIPPSACMTRHEFITLLRRIVETIGAPCLVYDACTADGQKMSAHIVCRRVAFRTSEAGRAYAVWMYEQVRTWIVEGSVSFAGSTAEMDRWVDKGIPKLNGQFKLPGNTKAEIGKRAQRPNHGLELHLAPLHGRERYGEILGWDEFDANRPWLTLAEARAVLRWPMADTVAVPPVFSLGYTQLEAYYATWSWAVCAARYGVLVPCYLDFAHMECKQGEGVVRPLDREGDPLVTVRVRPDPARWVVFNLHEETCAGHSRHDSCAVCWDKLRARARALLTRLGGHEVHLFYTGGNGVHLWLELRTDVERFAFAAPAARKLLGAMEIGHLVRCPGALHERTGRPSYPLPLDMATDVPPQSQGTRIDMS